jgi:coproporphyrinogen III oxidase
MSPDIDPVKDYLLGLQEAICSELETADGSALFSLEQLRPESGGLSQPRVMDAGQHLERAAVQFSHSIGTQLPPAATERNPDLRGKGFQATALSMIVHPRNPYVPTMHANLRFFIVEGVSWYFGGGFDLTPYYGFREDVIHWHQQAFDACAPFGNHVYPQCKADCDNYFYLPHRNEPRGVGGLFFDDWTTGGFEPSFEFVKSVGDHILPAYLPIVETRKHTPYGEREKAFQLYRRGRYAEFNLAIDRGTRYGLQSGRRIESVLASMPPRAVWKYDWHPEPDTPEAELYDYFLKPRDWLNEADAPE